MSGSWGIAAVPGTYSDPEGVEADLLCVFGWAATYPHRSKHEVRALELFEATEPDLFTCEAHRRVLEAMRRLYAERGVPFGWPAIYQELASSSSVDDRDSVELLPDLATREAALPACAPGLHAELVRRAAERRRWRDAVETLEEVAGAPVRVEVDE